MNDWASGYVTEINYTHGYYRELSPGQIALALLNQGVRVPPRGDRPLRYLELGFGQGLSLNIHAAACPGEYWGTDIIPAHAAQARDLAEACGSGARILDLSFAELAARDDLPEFDIITLHGIWSWISEENRAVVVDLIRRKLVVGGQVFISYNAAPGWAQAIPLRHLLTQHAELGDGSGRPIGDRIDAAVDFARQVKEAGGRFFDYNAGAADRLEKMLGGGHSYLAHEYFNRDWAPMPFSAVADALAAAKLTFAASGFLQDSVDVMNLSAAGQTLLAGIANPILRETTRDFLINRSFRKDVFVRGGLSMLLPEVHDRLRESRFVLTCAPSQVPRRYTGAQGMLELPATAIEPLIAILAEDNHRPKSVAEIEAHPAWAGQSLALLREVLVLMASSTAVDPAQAEAVTAQARPVCDALNRRILDAARYSGDMQYLASPVTGGGIMLTRNEQLLLGAHLDGHREPQAMAAAVWPILAAQGLAFTRDGKRLESAEDNLAELSTQAAGFTASLPRLQTLGLVPA